MEQWLILARFATISHKDQRENYCLVGASKKEQWTDNKSSVSIQEKRPNLHEVWISPRRHIKIGNGFESQKQDTVNKDIKPASERSQEGGQYRKSQLQSRDLLRLAQGLQVENGGARLQQWRSHHKSLSSYLLNHQRRALPSSSVFAQEHEGNKRSRWHFMQVALLFQLESLSKSTWFDRQPPEHATVGEIKKWNNSRWLQLRIAETQMQWFQRLHLQPH